MPHITDSIRPELTRLLPASVLIEVTCFVFYDHHPRDQKQIDLIVGTSNGEIKEYFRRGLVNSLNLEGRYQPTDVKIVRNGNCDLFYLVIAGDELTIVSRKEKPEIHRRVQNVERYGVEDAVCRGQGGLKVVIKDDAVPLVFNDNFEDLGDKASMLNTLNADDSLPILTELMRKLTQAKYSVKCNENTLKEFLSLRQVAALASYQKIHPNTEESIFNGNSTKVDEVLRVKSLTPWVKMCNKKIVIALIISYTNNVVPIEDIHILLHGTDRKTMVYVTKLYERIKAPPGWREKKTQSLISDNDVAIVTVIDIDEISKNYLNKMEFDGVIAYKREERDHVIPFEHVVLTSVDTMAEEFNALTGNNLDEMLSLAIVATTIRTELLLRHVKKQDEPSLMIPETFATHLQMEILANTDRTIIYKKSPYHIVNGCMLVFGEDCVANDCYRVFAYTISPTQLVVLIHYIHDAMPHTIVITTPNVKISPKSAKPSKREEETSKSAPKINYDDYASSLMNQTDLLLEYFDKCMTNMEVSKDMEIKSKIGSEIDFFAGGLPAYLEFRKKMLDEAFKGVKSLRIDDSDLTTNAALDVQMVID